ncbi:hypothetical protein SmphiM6_105 [Sinorhizobium phage phiM6]|nr:hypothetical protein SmphiM6_105 [Sinorhizobium phage phiM6]
MTDAERLAAAIMALDSIKSVVSSSACPYHRCSTAREIADKALSVTRK